MTPPTFHPACLIPPELPQAELQALADNIKEQNGLIYAITLMPDGSILDGRSRWFACQLAGVEPRFETYQGDDPYGYSRSLNIARRHLDDVQRAMCAARYATATVGRRWPDNPANLRDKSPTVEEAAEKWNVKARSVESAKRVLADGSPELIALADKGKKAIAISTAEEIARMPKAEQMAAVNTPKEQRREVVKARRGKLPPKQKRPVIEAGYITPKFPSHEETGYPVNGTLAEKDAHAKRYGRVALHPQMVKHRLEDRAAVTDNVGRIIMVAGVEWLTPAEFFEKIDALIAWTRQPDPDKMGYGIDFRTSARKQLEALDRSLPVAIERLAALQAAYTAWKLAHPAKVEEEVEA